MQLCFFLEVRFSFCLEEFLQNSKENLGAGSFWGGTFNTWRRWEIFQKKFSWWQIKLDIFWGEVFEVSFIEDNFSRDHFSVEDIFLEIFDNFQEGDIFWGFYFSIVLRRSFLGAVFRGAVFLEVIFSGPIFCRGQLSCSPNKNTH